MSVYGLLIQEILKICFLKRFLSVVYKQFKMATSIHNTCFVIARSTEQNPKDYKICYQSFEQEKKN